MSVVEFRKVLSEHVLPKALQRGVGRQRGSREASMSRHALSTAFCETFLPEGLNIRMQFFIASAWLYETLKIDFVKHGR